jgi:hypothetical protein
LHTLHEDIYNDKGGGFTFSFSNHNSCASFAADSWRIITFRLDPIAHCASHFKIKIEGNKEGTTTITNYTQQLPSSSMLRSVGTPSCDMLATGQISDVRRSRSFNLTLAECPTSQIICFADSRATCKNWFWFKQLK